MVRLLQGDCFRILQKFDDNSIDAVVTDPPAGIGFMGVAWDKKEGYVPRTDRGKILHDGISNLFESDLVGFAVFICDVFCDVFRVLKPGGHALVWSLPRTSDLTGLGLRAAGFEIRDSIGKFGALFGTGFPKSANISKQLDKMGGTSMQTQAQLLKSKREAADMSRESLAEIVGCTLASIRDWEEGRSRSKGAALEWIVPSLKYRNKLADTLGYTKDERKVSGCTVDRRKDGSVVGLGHSGVTRTGGYTDASKTWDGFGSALKPSREDWYLVRKPLDGTIAGNVLKHGTGGLNIDSTRIATGDSLDGGAYAKDGKDRQDYKDWRFKRKGEAGKYEQPSGRFPTHTLFEHHNSCEPCGTKNVKGSSGLPRHNKAKSASVAKSREYARIGHGHGDKDGNETVTQFSCAAYCSQCNHGFSAISGGAAMCPKCNGRADWICPVAALDAQSGDRKSGKDVNPTGNQVKGFFGGDMGYYSSQANYGDSGGASRFFHTFHYYTKTSRKERNAFVTPAPLRRFLLLQKYLKKNNMVLKPRYQKIFDRSVEKVRSHPTNKHPTVKPLSLMCWLVILVGCQPGSVILDPFMGTGSTGIAAVLKGFDFVGIEQDKDWFQVAQDRINAAHPGQTVQQYLNGSVPLFY